MFRRKCVISMALGGAEISATVNHLGEVGNLCFRRVMGAVDRNVVDVFFDLAVKSGGKYCLVASGSRLHRVLLRRGCQEANVRSVCIGVSVENFAFRKKSISIAEIILSARHD